MSSILVVDYDATWSSTFESLRARILPVISDVATSIEHVGSTAVPGLAAKPVIDIAHDIDGYVEAKTTFLCGILRESGFSEAQLAAIVQLNRRPTPTITPK